MDEVVRSGQISLYVTSFGVVRNGEETLDGTGTRRGDQKKRCRINELFQLSCEALDLRLRLPECPCVGVALVQRLTSNSNVNTTERYDWT